MLAKLVFWLIGSRELRVSAADTDRAARLLTGSGANLRRLRRTEEGLYFSLPLSDCEPVTRILANHGIRAEAVRERGLPYLVRRYRRRVGIPFGIGMFAAILILSEQFIWTVDVVGSRDIPAAEITARLEEMGVGVGTYIPGIDFDWLHNQMLIEHDDLAWIAVNVRGTAATVEVRERIKPDAVPDEIAPHNLVASEDGIVSYVEILRGVPVAEVDAMVREGELLASGIVEGKLGLQLVHARGSVIASVKRSIRVEVPLETTERVPSGDEYREKYLNIFGISLKFFGNTGKNPAECDKIIREYPLRFFGEIEVPVSVREVVYRAYTDETVTLTEEEAKAQAYRRLREECAALTETCELVSREIAAGMQDGAYVIECELRVLTDIAREAPIYTDKFNTEKES